MCWQLWKLPVKYFRILQGSSAEINDPPQHLLTGNDGFHQLFISLHPAPAKKINARITHTKISNFLAM
jgi:hypothetical protein